MASLFRAGGPDPFLSLATGLFRAYRQQYAREIAALRICLVESMPPRGDVGGRPETARRVRKDLLAWLFPAGRRAYGRSASLTFLDLTTFPVPGMLGDGHA